MSPIPSFGSTTVFYLRNVHSDLTGLAISRPMLECGVRRRLLQFPNVRIRDRCDVLGLRYDRDRNRVTGVRGYGKRLA